MTASREQGITNMQWERLTTEDAWLKSTDPEPFLRSLLNRDRSSADHRKLMLFCCACCRKVWSCFTDRRSQIAVERAEQYVEGTATSAEVGAVYRQALDYFNAHYTHRNGQAYGAAAECCQTDGAYPALRVYMNLRREQVCPIATPLSNEFFCQVLRDLFGNPFRPVVIDPALQTANAMSLAQAIYDERAFERMPILADALEDAGCTDASILEHCRSRGEHVRGCWVVDLLLAKE
jgi:hypothetical protein